MLHFRVLYNVQRHSHFLSLISYVPAFTNYDQRRIRNTINVSKTAYSWPLHSIFISVLSLSHCHEGFIYYESVLKSIYNNKILKLLLSILFFLKGGAFAFLAPLPYGSVTGNKYIKVHKHTKKVWSFDLSF